jgi:putative ABC transport system permease protein
VRNVTLKGLLAHKLRLVLTALAIILGVTFISGTYVLTDTLHNTFSGLFSNIYSKVDFQVRGVAQFGSGSSGAVRDPIPGSLLATIRRVPGVADADATVEGYAQFVAPDGNAIQTPGAPTLGINYNSDPRISVLRIIEGGPPTTADDVLMDAGTAQKYGFSVGQRVRILAGASLAGFTLPVAQEALGFPGLVDNINVVTAPGADKSVVQRDIAKILPSGVEVVTGETVVDESTSSIDQDLSFFDDALLIFAFIALFVGAFTIYNTFSIIVGQRTRELALLRVVGASRRQVFRSVLAEAAIVGVVSSALGVGLGVLAAIGLRALIGGFGISLPAGPLTFEPRTAVVGLIVGTVVTVVAAIGPARNAVRIAPVAALSERQAEDSISLRRLVLWGTGFTVAGVALLAAGLIKSAFAGVGVGAICLFIGVAMLAPAIARPLSGAIGRPLAGLLGEPGKLGRANSMRNPRRTAQTAAALMVGLALVSAVAVFGASVSRSATSSVDQAISADLILTSSGGQGFSALVPAVAAKVPGVTAETTIYSGEFEFQGLLESVAGVGTRTMADTLILRMTSGSPAALSNGELLIDSTTARDKDLSVGDTVAVKFAKTGNTTLRIGGIYQANVVLGSYLISDTFFRAHYYHTTPAAVLLRTDGSEAAVQRALSGYPDVQVQTRAQFEQSQAATVNELLSLVYALLALAVIIALVGIVNTLMLSVLERTREIGLLRAVGMRRPQVRSMIRSEGVILAIFGAVIGIVMGTLMGLALVAALRQRGISETVVPVSDLVIFIVLAAVLGLVAAGWPARRAARLDVLAAIASE